MPQSKLMTHCKAPPYDSKLHFHTLIMTGIFLFHLQEGAESLAAQDMRAEVLTLTKPG